MFERGVVDFSRVLERDANNVFALVGRAKGWMNYADYLVSRGLDPSPAYLTAQEDLERKLIQGLDSGDPIDITPAYWEKKRRELVERHARRKS
jgi:hypothetical protein